MGIKYTLDLTMEKTVVQPLKHMHTERLITFLLLFLLLSFCNKLEIYQKT